MSGLLADWATLATALGHFEAERFSEAEAVCREILDRTPDDFWTLRLLGSVHIQQEDFAKAQQVLEAAWAAGPTDDQSAVATMADLATVLGAQREYIASLEWAQAAVARKPDDVTSLHTYGNALLALGRYEEALAQYRAALARDTDSAQLKYNEGVILLTLGDWPRGWQQLESRLAMPKLFRPEEFSNSLPRWDGKSDVRGKTLLLQAEQGLGDTLQFLRFIPLLAERGPRIVLRVQPLLGGLLANYPGVDRVVTFFDQPADVELHCLLMSLPAIFGVTLDKLPANVPYLRPQPEYLLLWQGLLGRRKRPRIGLAWSGRQHLPLRSMPLATLAPLLAHDEYEFHVLQKEIPEADRDWLAAHPAFIDHNEELKDFKDTAALVSLMDLVISIDTSIAHLAGALGRPTWIMLPFSADAKWLLNRPDTPWYPTARLFRQRRLRDWDRVVANVTRALASGP